MQTVRGWLEHWRHFYSPLLIRPLSGSMLTTEFLHSQFKIADFFENSCKVLYCKTSLIKPLLRDHRVISAYRRSVWLLHHLTDQQIDPHLKHQVFPGKCEIYQNTNWSNLWCVGEQLWKILNLKYRIVRDMQTKLSRIYLIAFFQKIWVINALGYIHHIHIKN